MGSPPTHLHPRIPLRAALTVWAAIATAYIGVPTASAIPPIHPAGVPSTSPQDAAPQSAQVDPVAAHQQRQLQVFGPILLNPSDDISAETRRNAAAEILDMQIPEAVDVLRQALVNRRPVVALAAIAALQAHPTPPPALLDHCIAALEVAPTEVVAPLSAALARYGDDAATKVSALTTRPSTTARLNAVTALGSFRTREAAAALMRVIEAAPAGPNLVLDAATAEVTRAAIASLERMTGLSFGQDLAAWRTWWARAADDSPEQWYRLISESLAGRAATLQRQLAEQRQANERASRELTAAYRDLFPALPIDEQLRRLPRLLNDRLAAVRQFGLSRVSVLTRDSVRIPTEVMDLVRSALNDEAPEMRQAAAELLDELNDERAAAAIAARLAVENVPSVVSAMLKVLSRRPAASAIDPALRLLGDPVVADAAADALWEMMLAAAIPASRMDQVREQVRVARQARQSPEIIRLAALVGDEQDVSSLTALLDGDDRRLRAAAAEGFWKRSLRQPLLDRADDESIYPYAIRVIADGPADLQSFALLAGLRPMDAHRRLWSEMIVRLASRLQPSAVPAADEALRTLAYADLALRRDVLLASSVLQRDTLPVNERLLIIERLAPILLDLGDAARAWELLESINGSANGQPSLRVVRFQAAVLTGNYDRAAQLQTNAGEWIRLLGREVARNNPAAPRIYDEILRRFRTSLTPADEARLDEIREMLPGTEHSG